jgi:hypothetical protein
MFSGYAKNMSVAAALKETFDPAKPCEMCVGVATAKQDLEQKNLPATTEQNSGKLVLALQLSSTFVLVDIPDAWPRECARLVPSRSDRVPVPPPRA